MQYNTLFSEAWQPTLVLLLYSFFVSNLFGLLSQLNPFAFTEGIMIYLKSVNPLYL